MNKIKLGLIVAAAVAVAVAVAFAVGAISAVPKVPNVKFSDFSPEGTVTIKQGQQMTVKFNIINNEPVSASDVSVVTSHDGTLRVFQIDKPFISIASIGATDGRSGQQTITITGLANDQPALESNFYVQLNVGQDRVLTDTKTFKLRLEK